VALKTLTSLVVINGESQQNDQGGDTTTFCLFLWGAFLLSPSASIGEHRTHNLKNAFCYLYIDKIHAYTQPTGTLPATNTKEKKYAQALRVLLLLLQ
jgi:hypothetical protein